MKTYMDRLDEVLEHTFPLFVDEVQISLIHEYVDRERKRLNCEGIVAPMIEELYGNILALENVINAENSAHCATCEYLERFIPDDDDDDNADCELLSEQEQLQYVSYKAKTEKEQEKKK